MVVRQMERFPELGDLELEVLRFVQNEGPVTVGEAAAHFAESRGLARTTIQTVMERLRGKQVLTRSDADGVYRYAVADSRKRLNTQMIRDFVKRNLGGDISPLAAFLAESEGLTEAEASVLRQLAAESGSESAERGAER